MKTIKEKIKNKKGETIGEVLVALLISGLALLMLAGAITSSSRLITNSRKLQEDYLAKNEILNASSGGTTGDNTKITIKTGTSDTGGDALEEKKVKYNVNDTISRTPIIAYIQQETAPAGS